MSAQDIRARLKDRQTKTGALGTAEDTVCLDLSLVEELEQIQRDLLEAENADRSDDQTSGKSRLGASAGSKKADSAAVTELKKRREAKEQEVRDASLRLVFRSVGSSRYQELVNANPEADDDAGGRAEFMNDLASACLVEVWDGKEKVDDLTWSEIAEAITFGEWDTITTKVFALNRRKVDVPFSLRPSKVKPS